MSLIGALYMHSSQYHAVHNFVIIYNATFKLCESAQYKIHF
jgi:hypothetical protein